MKLLRSLLLTALLVFVSGAATAGVTVIIDDVTDKIPGILDDDFRDDTTKVPEPAAALVMATGLVTVAAVRRLRRR